MSRIIHDGGSYRILHQEGTRRMHVRIDGALLEREPTTELDAAIDTLHERTVGKQRLSLDLRNCPYATAPAVGALLRWVTLLRAIPPQRRYRLVILSNDEHTWQRTTLVNLCRYAGDCVEITREAAEDPSIGD
jgi:hypothetical protein